jgi:lysophospholipase L1-like esterase
LQQILQRKENKPDAIFIKECAAYFPGDFQKYQELIKSWVQQCKWAGVIPIPTTVVPVVREQSFVIKVKDLVKWILGRSTTSSRLTAILQYNDWIKLYSEKEVLIIMDLEAPLRIGLQDRSLSLDLHAGDGLHLNEKAYSLLDKIVLPTLDEIFRRNR